MNKRLNELSPNKLMNEFRTKTADGYWNESQYVNIVPINKRLLE